MFGPQEPSFDELWITEGRSDLLRNKTALSLQHKKGRCCLTNYNNANYSFHL